MSDLKRTMLAALAHRQKHGGHMHHQHCIHNMTPEEQITMRGKTVDWWMKWVGTMPVQISPDDWEIDPPEFVHDIEGNGTDA